MTGGAMYRDRRLLDLARLQPCLLRVPGVCRNDHDTVVACHSNALAHGKGKGLKAHDFFTVWGCHACHTWLDSGRSSHEERACAFERAHERQVAHWLELAASVTIRPERREAAMRAVQAYADFLKGERRRW